MHYALDRKNWEIVKFLLQQEGIDLNIDMDHYTDPLREACRRNMVDIVEKMVKIEGVDLNTSYRDGNTSLHIACRRNDIAIARILLLHKGISVTFRISMVTNTPVTYCC